MISASGLDKTFTVGGRGLHTLRSVAFDAPTGQFLVVIGASGSGKTTLLRSVAGLESPEGGVVRLRDRVVFDAAAGVDVPPQRRQLGMVFQSYAIWPHMSVLDNVVLPLMRGHRRLGRQAARQAALDALEMVGIAALADRPAPLLSGGQQQRVALARALAVSSDVLLMDEPLSNLDARLRDEVRRELKALTSRLGATVLYVTHDRAEAMALGERLLVLDQGAVVQVGPPDQVYGRPATRKLAEFLGHVNWLDGSADGRGHIATALGSLRAACRTASGQSVTVGVRPEHIELSCAPAGGEGGPPAGGSDVNAMPAVAVAVQFLGSHAVVEVEAGGRRLVVESRGTALPAPGDPVGLRLPPEQLLVFEHGEEGRLLPTPDSPPSAGSRPHQEGLSEPRQAGPRDPDASGEVGTG